MAETIAPMLAGMKVSALRQALDAEQEVATAQRLGFVLETLGASTLAECVFEWLPKKVLPAPLAPHGKNSGEVLPHPKMAHHQQHKGFLMIQLTQRDILAHQSLVPWPNQRQVEQGHKHHFKQHASKALHSHVC